jgi:hypothetical protein
MPVVDAPPDRDPKTCSAEDCSAAAVILFALPDGDGLSACHEHAFECSQEAWKLGCRAMVSLPSPEPVMVACPGCGEPMVVNPNDASVRHSDCSQVN